MTLTKNQTNGVGGKARPSPRTEAGVDARSKAGDESVPVPAAALEPDVPGPSVVPDPEVVTRATRRRYTAEFKRRVLRAADACTKPGEVGALLRREGIYSSLLTVWRRERERGELAGLTPKKRGAKPSRDPRDAEVARLKRELDRLQERLRIAELVCDAQKKVALILGITLAKPDDDGKPS